MVPRLVINGSETHFRWRHGIARGQELGDHGPLPLPVSNGASCCAFQGPEHVQ